MEEPDVTVNWTGGDGLTVVTQEQPSPWHEFTGGGLPCPVRVRVALDGDGRPVCTGVVLADDTEVTTRTLRAIPLRRLMTYVAARLETVRDLPAGEVEFDEASDAIFAELVALGAVKTEQPPRTGRRGRPRLTDEQLSRFMRAYNEARRHAATADAPIRAVAEHMHMSRAAAHRWLRTARERGITGSEGTS